ncbi:MAG: hypothetical protein L3J74_06400 [Bacteroidales bacterium]|nr:hypothetical protein [Bacteroidales bacterium]
MQQKFIILIINMLIFSQAFAQIEIDTTKKSENPNSGIIIQNDTLIQSDTSLVVIDSAYIKLQEFIRDSLIAREKFIKDSIYRRKLILDSVTFLKQNLPKLIEAVIKSTKEEIIIYTEPVYIIGDSALSDFSYRILLQKIDAPYAPWKEEIKLSEKSFKIKIDTINKQITKLHLDRNTYIFNYDNKNKAVVITGRSTIIRKANGNIYKIPIDSVFFDRNNRVKIIKKYTRVYQATKDYKKGALLYTDINKLKEFRYFPGGELSFYKLISYCGRSTGKEKNSVCHTLTYSICKEGKKFTIVKKNEPENVYSDGTFVFEYDDNFNLKSMEFNNANHSLNRNCIVELNQNGYVSRYLYRKNGIINKTIVIKYNDDPDAKDKVEMMAYFFEEDGISYFQKNLNNGKTRKRDKLTMKWGPWK